jgi:hypothetical protein
MGVVCGQLDENKGSTSGKSKSDQVQAEAGWIMKGNPLYLGSSWSVSDTGVLLSFAKPNLISQYLGVVFWCCRLCKSSFQ